MLDNPEMMRECEHTYLLQCITASIGERSSHFEVKSHIGVRGNELADKGAAGVAKGSDVDYATSAANESTNDLYCWPTTKGSPLQPTRSLNNLTEDVHAYVRRNHEGGRTNHTKFTDLQHVATETSEAQSSNHMWRSSCSICAITNALKIRYNQIYTAAAALKHQRPYMRGLVTPCPALNGECFICGVWRKRQRWSQSCVLHTCVYTLTCQQNILHSRQGMATRD